MKKKVLLSIILIVLSAVMLCSCALPESLMDYNYKTPGPAYATDPGTEGLELQMVSVIRGNYISEEISDGFGVTIYKNGVQIDSVQDTNSKNIIIPETIMGYSVIGIGKRAFYGNSSLEQVNLPDTLKYIDTAAFCYCTNLKINCLPDSLIYLGGRVFNFCENIETMDFPDAVTYMGEYVLASTSVKNIDIPLGMTFVPVGLYYDTEIEKITIPSHVTLIKESAFANCMLIEELLIPSNVVEIEQRAFAYNLNLKTVVIEEGIIDLTNAVFAACLSLESITLPESVMSISTKAFLECYDDFVICGKAGSKTEEYAIAKKYEFVAIE